jgi:hypothetical protein
VELEKAIAISHNLDDNLLIAVQKGNLGWAYYKKAELATATNLMKQANTIIDETMSHRWQGFIKANLACTMKPCARARRCGCRTPTSRGCSPSVAATGSTSS